MSEDNVYRCEGCGRLTNSPESDLRDIKARGGISCCPERDMRPMSSADILRMIADLRSPATLSTSEASQPVAVMSDNDFVVGVSAGARAIYEQGPSIGGDTEDGWAAQSEGYKQKARALAHVVITSLSAAPSPEASQPDAGEVTILREALQKLLLCKDLFDVSDRNQADAYYLLAKQDAAWNAARAALSPTDGANNSAASEGER